MNLKKKYIDYFKSLDHAFIPSAPLVPENDPTVLFNTAGMQPLVPYLMGQPHPSGKRLVNCQKCVRLTDLDEIGDTTHHTFFEMLGNWSLGDYFKDESIEYSFNFLTQVLNIPLDKLAVTCYQGNNKIEKDMTSYNKWISLGISPNRIAFLDESHNFWGPAGTTGPCGPDTEIFYYRSENKTPEIFDPNDNNWVEIWNNVFMEFNKDEDGNYTLLANKNVDTGMGLERTVSILENKQDNYLSSVWINVIKKIEELSGLNYECNEKSMRIIADHIRTSIMIATEDTLIKPSNTDQGYILRRLIRRFIRHARLLNIDINSTFERELASIIIEQYKEDYSHLERNKEIGLDVLTNEKIKFNRTLEKGLKEFDKLISTNINIIDGTAAFKLYDTYGFPIELVIELASELSIKVDLDGFNAKFIEHQEKSRAGSVNKFKGGLSGNSEMDIRYHTATHLLNAALKVVLDNSVHQKGSNNTVERLRFDFSWDKKLTPEEIKAVEDLVNQYIKDSLDVSIIEMSKDDAIKSGAECMFVDKYPDMVTVYKIGNISSELCGGPHVSNTSELGIFKIIKEEASSSGVRRIKAVLTNN